MSFKKLLPGPLCRLLLEIEEKGHHLCLVGGAARQYLFHQVLERDLDFEIRGESVAALYDKIRRNKFESIKFNQKNVEMISDDYQILRVKFMDFDLEFVTPRMEFPLPGKKGHHHFAVNLDLGLDYKDAFKRRDLTVNAIGLELNLKNDDELKIDPYDGASDYIHKILRNIDDAFFLDPVRFLRLIRFEIKWNFQIDINCESKLSEFDLQELTTYYLKDEIEKSKKHGTFINNFVQKIKNYKINIPQPLEFILEFKFTGMEISWNDLMASGFNCHGDVGAKKLCDFFCLPIKDYKDLTHFAQSYALLKKIGIEELKKLIETPFEEIKVEDCRILEILKSLDRKQEWGERLGVPTNILRCVFRYEKDMSQKELMKISNPKFRSFFKYYQALKALSMEELVSLVS